eukprot:gene23023-20454_t
MGRGIEAASNGRVTKKSQIAGGHSIGIYGDGATSQQREGMEKLAQKTVKGQNHTLENFTVKRVEKDILKLKDPIEKAQKDYDAKEKEVDNSNLASSTKSEDEKATLLQEKNTCEETLSGLKSSLAGEKALLEEHQTTLDTNKGTIKVAEIKYRNACVTVAGLNGDIVVNEINDKGKVQLQTDKEGKRCQAAYYIFDYHLRLREIQKRDKLNAGA